MEGVISIRNSAGAGMLVPPVRLSEQEFVDCTKRVQANYDYFGVRRRKFNRRYGSYGCDGAFLKDGAPCLTATILTQLSKLAASTAGMLRR